MFNVEREWFEKPEELNTYEIRISEIRRSVSNLNALIYELKESINQFNKKSSKYSKKLYCLTIILTLLTGIMAILVII